jgi:carbamoylphosphate synthase small subunit
MSKIYTCAWGTGGGSPYPFGDEGITVHFPEELTANDGFLVIWGGEDIHPSIYNEPNVGSFVGGGPSRRDLGEIALIKRAEELGMLVVGVCRGAQLCCALAGGKLAQDVSNHGMSHPIQLAKGGVIKTSSVHHQMMYPHSVPHELIAWSINRSNYYVGLTENEVEQLKGIEPEIVYFPEKKYLAIQGHPEFMDENCDFNVFCRSQIQHYSNTVGN